MQAFGCTDSGSLPAKLGRCQLSLKKERVPLYDLGHPDARDARKAGVGSARDYVAQASLADIIRLSNILFSQQGDTVLRVAKPLLPDSFRQALSAGGDRYADDFDDHVKHVALVRNLNIEDTQACDLLSPGGFELSMVGLNPSERAKIDPKLDLGRTVFLTPVGITAVNCLSYPTARLKLNALLIAKGLNVTAIDENVRHTLAGKYLLQFLIDLNREALYSEDLRQAVEAELAIKVKYLQYLTTAGPSSSQGQLISELDEALNPSGSVNIPLTTTTVSLA